MKLKKVKIEQKMTKKKIKDEEVEDESVDSRIANKSWRLSNLYTIKNKKAELVKFEPNKAQKHFSEHAWTRNIILKSRQLGFTTFEAIDSLDDVLFNRNFDSLFISQDLDTSKDIFDNKISLAWDNLRLKFWQPDMESARKLKFSFGDAEFSSIAVDSSGRSGTYHRLHITEFALICKMYPEKAREIIEGSIPAVPTNGRVDIESTAQEAQGKFYDMFWEAWERGDPKYPTEFKAHFYNWTWDEEIQSMIEIPTAELPEAFVEYQKKMKLSGKEITYYYLKWLSLNKDWGALRREYPTTPEEAFEGAGDKLFDIEKLGQFNLAEGERIGNFTIYEKYRLGHRYGMGCDVAEGIGRDSSTIALWDFTPAKPKIVAEYKNSNIAPDMFAYDIRNLAEKYEQPIVAVERNNHGHTTISKLREIYPERAIWKDDKGKFGWLTTGVSKPQMFYDGLVTAVNEEQLDIPSKNIVSEMRRCDKEMTRVVKQRDDDTEHFDILMAAAIGFQMKAFATVGPKKAPEPFTPKLSPYRNLR